ncbi:MAG: hypothetical protein GY835_00655 [bacterium]|nr:hypothetical protein [bacterium]
MAGRRFPLHCLILFVMLASQSAIAQPIPFTSDRWDMSTTQHRMESWLGRESLFLEGGTAWLKDVDFTDGVFEFDISCSGPRGFNGLVFRYQDEINYEHFYFRPHQSGNPDATQYTPVFNGVSGWQLYHGEGFSTAVEVARDRWQHVKIAVAGDQAELYLDRADEPFMFIADLKRATRAGRIGVHVNPGFSPAHFTDFRVISLETPELSGAGGTGITTEPGTIMSWNVSSAFNYFDLHEQTAIPSALKSGLSWNNLECETSGLLNVARIRTLASGHNSVFLRTVLEASEEQVVGLDLAFSDVVMVYLNGTLLYAGNDIYRSRDYRFLGSIGYFDRVYLPLDAGENELWIAVAESFGGWGLKACLATVENVKVDGGVQR